jgi:hypothetical protein
MSASPSTDKAFRDACCTVPLVSLGSDFSTLEAGEATAGLLKEIAERLQSAPRA